MGHYLIIIVIIALVLIYQVKVFGSTSAKISKFKDIFKGIKDKGEYAMNLSDYENLIILNNFQKANPNLKKIIEALNNYLFSNKNRANDYQLMKDIVDRNCDSEEEDITSQIPIPLYLGLVGTMLGIIIGVGFLFFTGGIGALLGTGEVDAQGIEALLGGVALAMIASVCGIILTTIGTYRLKDSKSDVYNGKDEFLSWIQAKLLPQMSSDVSYALEKLGTTLTDFNNGFGDKTANLKETLDEIHKTSESQAELYNRIDQLDIKKMAKANVEVFNALQHSTSSIERIASVFNNSESYLAQVMALNAKLDEGEKRMKMIEEMGNFFQSEMNAIEERKLMLANQIDSADDAVLKAMESYKGKLTHSAGDLESKVENVINEITEKSENQLNEYTKFLGKQEDALKERTGQLEKVLGEISSLKDIKESLANYDKAIKTQNEALSSLSKSVNSLAMRTDNQEMQESDSSNKIMQYTIAGIAAAILVVEIIRIFI